MVAAPAGSGPLPEVAIDAEGGGLCSAVHETSSGWHTGVRSYAPGTGWGAPVNIALRFEPEAPDLATGHAPRLGRAVNMDI